MVCAFDYQFLTESPERFKAAMEEYEPLMQDLLDEELNEVFSEDKYTRI